jgi:hypothetical protein
LREGRVQEADNEITAELKAAVAAGTAPEAVEPPPVPRTQPQVLNDILAELIAFTGNKDSLLKLLAELEAVH